MISIYENETDVDRKRYLMRQSNYNFVTMSGAKKAYNINKRYCDHMMNALLLHDGSNIAMTVRAKSVDIEIKRMLRNITVTISTVVESIKSMHMKARSSVITIYIL
ncbi:hypothetical protein RB195_016951 [Necator americanus]|uniref:Uncharacterized protein n=1 Tax=Necator americanus TaxID=51031 RepID=A0ABR1C2X2_NECAM